MSLFKRAFAITVNEYLTEHRISHAQRLLATTEQRGTGDCAQGGGMDERGAIVARGDAELSMHPPALG
jgi:AraC-like DNA-binding protein